MEKMRAFATQNDYSEVLASPDFRYLWLASLVSRLGDMLYDIGLLWLISEQTKSAIAVGSVVISTALPMLFFGLIGGAVADRFERRRILILTDVLRALLVLCVPVLFFFGGLTPATASVIAFLRSTCSRFFYPAQQATLPSTVGSEQLSIANSLNQTSNTLIMAVAPAIAGLLIALFSAVTAFYIDAATFIISAFLISRINHSVFPEPKTKDVTIRLLGTDIMDGLRYVFRNPLLRLVAITSVVNIFAFGPYRPILLVYLQDEIGMDAGQFGINLSAAFIGFSIGALVAGNIIKRISDLQVYVVGLFTMGIFSILIAVIQFIPAIYIVSGFRSFGNGLIVVAFTTILQASSEVDKLGRVFSTMGFLSEALRPVSIVAGSFLADVFGNGEAIIATSLLFPVAALIAIFGAWLNRLDAEVDS